MPYPTHSAAITGIVLAGGAGQRLGHVDKGLLPVAGVCLVERVLARLAPQVQALCIVANRNLPQYQAIATAWGARLTQDAVHATDPHQGPLAGFVAGLGCAATPLALIVPVDAAQLPLDLAARLCQAGAPSYVAEQPTCALLACDYLMPLASAYAGGERSPQHWLRSLPAATVDFSDWPAPYWSLNTPEQQLAVEALLLG